MVAQAAPASMAQYQYLLAQYLAARQRRAEADAYWSVVADKRQLRVGKRRSGQDVLLADYVLTQPPLYAGPSPPIDPSAPSEEPPKIRAGSPTSCERRRRNSSSCRSRREARSSTSAPTRQGRGRGRAHARAGSPHLRVRSGGNGKYDVQAEG